MITQFMKHIHIFVFLFLAVSIPAFAQEKKAQPVIQDFINVYSHTADKMAQLAAAIPEDTYDWRPAEGIRSVKESILHATGATYFFGGFLGAKTPEGLNTRELEKADMSKEEVIAALKQAVEIVQGALKNITALQLEEEVDFFGTKMTKRQTVFLLGDHTAEHLGQLIAYARSNDVTPPWSKKN